MSDTSHTWRDEIEHILAEIAADPKAKLLRVPTVDDALSLANQAPVGVMAPSLTKAERHLLSTHREELAFLLRERCVMDFYGRPDASRSWHRSVTKDRDVEVPREADWSARADRVLRFDDGRHEQEANDVIGACLAGRSALRFDQLANVSLRIAPSESARVYSALHQLDLGRFDESRSILDEVRSETRSATMASMCWENIGFSFLREVRSVESVLAYRSAALASSERVAPALFWLSTAIATGDAGSATAAAGVVDDRVPDGHSAVRWTEAEVHRYVESGASRGQRKSILGQLESCGPVATRVLNAFQA